MAVDNGDVIGTLGLMKIDEKWSVLKKFFVHKAWRSKRIGLLLYEKLLAFAKSHGVHHIILDTPSVAVKSHAFYERSGFIQVKKTDLPIKYEYPDRNSLLYRLDL